MKIEKTDFSSRWHKYRYVISFAAFLVFYIPLDFFLGYLTLSPPMPSEGDGYRRPHAAYHHELSPLFQGKEQWGGNQYSVKTNSLAFKDKENKLIEKQNDSYRILFIGDSFTEGIGQPYEKTFVGIIADKLEKIGIEVLNAGVVSYSPKLYYLKIKHLIEEQGVHFDELHVFIDISDPQDEIIREKFEPDKLTEGGSFFRLSQAQLERTLFSEYLSISDYSLTSRFVKYKLFEKDSPQVRARLRAKEIVHPIPQGFDKNFYSERDEWITDPSVYESWGKKGLELCEKNMSSLAKLCKQHGIALKIAVYPWPLQVKKQTRNSLQETAWHSFCEKNRLDFLNLFPVFLDGKEPQTVISELFIPHDVHWNESGHGVVAKSWLKRFLPHLQRKLLQR